MAKKGPEQGYCPKCHRRTWSVKYRRCTGCGEGEPEPGMQGDAPMDVESRAPLPPPTVRYDHEGAECAGTPPVEPATGVSVTTTALRDARSAPSTFVGERPKREGVVRENVELVPGKPCPLCGKKVARSPAQLQREYRQREADDE